jgi:PAS domain S-box-containing protein
MKQPLRVLLVEDSEDDCALILRELSRGGYQPEHRRVEDEAGLRDALAGETWQIVLSDYSLPAFSGPAVLKILRELSPDLPCIIVSGAIGEDAAVTALRQGARDYVMKDRLTRLSVAVGQQLSDTEAQAARRQAEAEVRRRGEEVAALHAISKATGKSLELAEVVDTALVETLRVLNAGAGAVFLRDEHGGLGDPVSQHGFSRPVVKEILPIASGVPAAEAAARVIQTGDPRHLSSAAAAGWTALILIPIGAQGGEAGVLVAASREEGAAGAFSLGIAEGIGRQVGVAVQNAQLHEGLQGRTRHLEALLRVNETLRATQPLTTVLDTIARSACSALGAVAALILIPDAAESRLEVGAASGTAVMNAALRLTGLSVEGYSIRLSAEGNPVARAYREGRMQEWSGGLAPTLDGLEPAVNRTMLPLFDMTVGSRAAAFVPLPSGRKTVGVLGIFMPRSAFTPAERLLLSGLADQGGLAVDSARLFAEAQALREFNEGIVEGMAEALIIQNESGRITFANPAAETLLGFPRRELLRRHWHDLFAAGAADQLTGDALTGGATRRFETELVTQEGGTVPVIVSARPLRTDGPSSGILAAITDISERVRSERLLAALNRASLAMAQAMSHEEAFAAASRELAVIGCTTLLLLLSKDATVLKVRFHDYPKDTVAAFRAIAGVEMEKLELPLERVHELWARIEQRTAIPIFDGVALLKDMLPGIDADAAERLAGILELAPCIAAPMVIEGRVFGVAALLCRGLTQDNVPAVAAYANQVAAVWNKNDLLLELRGKLEELQRVQGQLVQAQKMEAIGRLAGGVAHDFNNQLTAIMGTAELLLERVGEDAGARQEIEEIQATVHRSAALTRQLLAFSRKQTINPIVLDPGELVRGMQKMLGRLIGEDVRLEISIPEAVGNVRVDPGQLEQVVMNLVVNARDAMPRGGRLSISGARVELRADESAEKADAAPGRYVSVTVTDTGTGMDAETRSHIFEPFFTTKPVGEGTGLGLATAYGIVRQGGGFISVESEQGKGSSFTVHLPLVEREVEARPAARESLAPTGGSQTILLVEDDALVRSLVRRTLSRAGYTVLEAYNGEEGLRVEGAAQGPVHLLLSDVVIPGAVTSKAMAEKIAARRPGIRILYTSGYPDQAVARHGVLDPSLRFLPKPFTPKQLLSAVREALIGV